MHELDLPLGAMTIGRGADCQVTLSDPLVSRQHVRIFVGSDRVVIEDLNSRNGVLVNGAALRGLTQLRDGDRIRIGTQELVFRDQAFTAASPIRRATGELRQLLSCPTCDEIERVDEGTLTGKGSPGIPVLPLLVEALDHALSLGRVADAERLARRTSDQINQLVAAGGSVDAALLATLAGRAAELTCQSKDPTWALWALDVYRETHQVPPVDLVERLADVGKAAALGLLARSEAR